MSEITKLLNIISDFSCEIEGDKISFIGILQKVDNNIVINARTLPPECQKMMKHHDLNIYTRIDGCGVTCFNAYIKSASGTCYEGGKYNGYDYTNLIIVPDQIVVGGCFDAMPQVEKISTVIPELNYFFMYSSSPLKLVNDFSKDNPSVLNFTSLKTIYAEDKYGKVKIWRTFGQKETANELSFNFVPYVSYEFYQAIKLDKAIEHIASIRNLFSFFADGYIGLGKISFKIPEGSEEYYVWMNHEESVKPVQENFCVTFNDIENDFQSIWTTWANFYDNTQSLIDLFYEIICGRSTRVNELLNFAQAIEVYSNTHLDSEARKFAKGHEWGGKSGDSVPLKFIFWNLLKKYNDIFEINELDINSIAEALSNNRNYYTHYNSKRLKPSYKEIFAATRVLHYMLLIIIYKSIGIPYSAIGRCKKMRLQFSYFAKDINCLKNFYSNKPNNIQEQHRC